MLGAQVAARDYRVNLIFPPSRLTDRWPSHSFRARLRHFEVWGEGSSRSYQR